MSYPVQVPVRKLSFADAVKNVDPDSDPQGSSIQTANKSAPTTQPLISKQVVVKNDALNEPTVKSISAHNEEGVTQSNESLPELNNLGQSMANYDDPSMETEREMEQNAVENCDKVTTNDNENDNDDIDDEEQEEEEEEGEGNGDAKQARTPGKDRFRFFSLFHIFSSLNCNRFPLFPFASELQD